MTKEELTEQDRQFLYLLCHDPETLKARLQELGLWESFQQAADVQ